MIYNAPIQDMLFLTREWIGMDRITSLPGFEEVDADLIEAVLEEAGKFASSELLTINREGDEHGAVYSDGTVTTPPGFKEAYKNFIEAGWTSIDASPDHGGQGLPKLLQSLIDEILGATNVAFKLYTELSRGAYHCMAHAASDEICDKYLPKLVEGVWSGTMCLTEPHCGTDLGMIRTKAEPQEDGTYRITGQKIWISAGEHDMSENIIHMVLAKIDDGEGVEAGSRGISLFLVPKFLLDENGRPALRNVIEISGLNHKMGQRGIVNTVPVLGGDSQDFFDGGFKP